MRGSIRYFIAENLTSHTHFKTNTIFFAHLCIKYHDHIISQLAPCYCQKCWFSQIRYLKKSKDQIRYKKLVYLHICRAIGIYFTGEFNFSPPLPDGEPVEI